MTINCQVTLDDYVKAHRLAHRPRPWLRMAMWTVAIVYVVFAVTMTWAWISSGTAEFSNWLVLFLGPYFAALYFVWLPARVKKLYLQQKGPKEFNAEIRADAVRLTSERGDVTLPLVELHKWKKNSDMVLLFHSDALYHIFARRWFSSNADFERFHSILETALGPGKP